MARIVWERNGLINIKLRDDLYTIGQMLVSPTVRFFDICNKDGVWKTVDLNEIKPLFQAYTFTELDSRQKRAGMTVGGFASQIDYTGILTRSV